LNHYTSSISTQYLKKIKIYLSGLYFSSDDKLLFSTPITYFDYVLDHVEEFFIFLDKSLNEQVLGLISISISASQKVFIIKRIYQKFIDFMALITGLLSQVYFL
jgi:hypothetical protein